MASVVPISSLTTRSCRVRIRARVLKIWNAQRGGQMPFGVNFLLLDAQGGAIQGLFLAADYNRAREAFAVGRLCEIGRFNVRNVNAAGRTVSHGYSLYFSADTTVSALPDGSLDIPNFYFEFKPLRDIFALPLETVTDVFGRLTGFSPVENVQSGGRDLRVRNMYLADERGTILEISLWEQFIDHFDAASLAERSRTEHVIIACSALVVRDYKGLRGLRTFVASEFYVGLDLPDYAPLRACSPQDVCPMFVDGVAPIRALHGAGSVSAARLPPRKVTLCELSEVDVLAEPLATFECVVQIIGLPLRFGWSYPSCPNCSRRVQDSDSGVICKSDSCPMSGERVEQPIPWFRLPVEVSDGTAQAEFVLIGKHAEFVVGCSALILMGEVNPNPDDAPPSLLQIVGRRYLFVVSASRVGTFADHRNYTVSRVGPVPPEFAAIEFPGSSSGVSLASTVNDASGSGVDKRADLSVVLYDDAKLKGAISSIVPSSEDALDSSSVPVSGMLASADLCEGSVLATPPPARVCSDAVSKSAGSSVIAYQRCPTISAKRKLDYDSGVSCSVGEEPTGEGSS